MNDLELRLGDESIPITFNDDNNAHIQSVEVFTGDDGYKETDCYRLSANGGALAIESRKPVTSKESSYRIRNEPCVRLNVATENGTNLVLSVTHHKGTLYLDTKKV
jgi:hypothetical protein